MPAQAPSSRPKYLRLKQDLEEQIRSGRLVTLFTQLARFS